MVLYNLAVDKRDMCRFILLAMLAQFFMRSRDECN